MFDNPFSIVLRSSADAAKDNSIAHFTIFGADNVYRSDPLQILELAEAAGENILEKVVSYKSERLALHWTAAYLNLTAKINNDSEYEALVREIYKKYILPNIQEITAAIELHRQEITVEVKDLVDALRKGSAIPDHGIAPVVQQFYSSVTSRFKTGVYKPGQYNEDETLDSVVTKLATDLIYRNSEVIEDVLRQYVEEKIAEAFAGGAFSALKLSNEGYRSIVIAGATGSGKSTFNSRIAGYFHEEGIATITRDNFRRLLLNNPEEAIAAVGSITWLSHDEASSITPKVEKVLRKISNDGKGVPVSVMELSSAKEQRFVDTVVDCSEKRNQPTYFYFIYLPADKALNRAFIRSKDPDKATDKSKDVEPEIVIGLHRGFGTYLESALETYRDKNIVFEIVDNDVPKGNNFNTIAFGRTKNAEFNILDFSKVVDYLKKRFLNPKAASYEQLYDFPPDANEQIRDSLKKINNLCPINFADANTGHIYACMNQDGIIEVYDKQAFAGIAAEPVMKLFEVRMMDGLVTKYASRQEAGLIERQI